tara:strand:- start:101 stop:883 length:783 start_codon:yes stop_codon:yes gene_type:complete
MNSHTGKKIYDESFYNQQMDGSYRSATLYVKHLLKIFKPHSVADLGCGKGTWLKAFKENGVEKLVGFDGNWIKQEEIVDQAVTFFPIDLNKPFLKAVERFDLAISVEVAEHLKEESSKTFVDNITALSDVVMFGAAYTDQGGLDHINEQPATYWAKMFIENGYTPYDIFRSTFWDNQDIEWWYQQNTFLYVKNNSKINQTLKEVGYQPISNIKFMNCIHPNLYSRWVSTAQSSPIKLLLKAIIPKTLLPFVRRLKRQVLK